eukprot:3791606-Alexandrium_andersonii.AAC.1
MFGELPREVVRCSTNAASGSSPNIEPPSTSDAHRTANFLDGVAAPSFPGVGRGLARSVRPLPALGSLDATL